MKPFKYKYSKLLNPVIVNQSGTNIKTGSAHGSTYLLLNVSSGKIEYIDFPVLVENEITSPEQSENPVFFETKPVKSFTFYCVAGTEFAEGGDGTENNPWASVNYALNQIQPIIDCFYQTYCCEYIQLRCSGVCSYPIRAITKNSNGSWEDTTFNGRNLFILRDLIVDIQREDEDVYGIKNINNSVLYSCNIGLKLNNPPSGTEHVYERCNNSIFYYCDGNCELSLNNTLVTGIGSCFINCEDSRFYFCNANSLVSNIGIESPFVRWTSSAAGFNECTDSLFYHCSSTAEGSCSGGIYNSGYGRGFDHCNQSVFYFCEGLGSGRGGTPESFGGEGRGVGIGFDSCIKSSFYSCKGTGISYTKSSYSESRTSSYGFYYDYLGSFYFCSGIADGNSVSTNGNAYSFTGGFDSCEDSLFYFCNGSANAFANARYDFSYLGCGFRYNYDSSSFYECTTSPKVCGAKNPQFCENTECDI